LRILRAILARDSSRLNTMYDAIIEGFRNLLDELSSLTGAGVRCGERLPFSLDR